MTKHKKIIIPFAILLGLIFWPLAIGLLFSWLIYKFINFKKIKYIAIVMILLSTFSINSVWTKALFNVDSYKNPPKAQTVQSAAPVQDQITAQTTPVITEIPIQATTSIPTPTPTLIIASSPTSIPSSVPTAIITKPPVIITPKVTIQSVVVQQTPIINTGGSYACNCSRTCTQILSCVEAQYQLNSCGCKQRDADHDGIACDSAPLHCQQ